MKMKGKIEAKIEIKVCQVKGGKDRKSENMAAVNTEEPCVS
jgi:hypothetical protein